MTDAVKPSKYAVDFLACAGQYKLNPVLSLMCGSAEDEIFLAQNGLDVYAADNDIGETGSSPAKSAGNQNREHQSYLRGYFTAAAVGRSTVSTRFISNSGCIISPTTKSGKSSFRELSNC